MNCCDKSSGINSLPHELLAKIFSTVIVATKWQKPWKLPSPALLLSVCSHWRIVAENTPELWVNINVPLHKSPDDCRRRTAEWIARSGILPITVMITMTTDRRLSRSIPPHLTDIMGLLSQNSERLHHLALHSRSSATIQRTFSLLQSALNLQRLTIYCNGYSSSWIQVESHQYLPNFPRLTILETQGSMVSPIPNLTSLIIGNLSASYDDISQYFTASPGLQHLILHNLLPLASPLPNADSIHADSLRSLAVSLAHWPDVDGEFESPHILSYLAMPNIKYLELCGDAWTESDFGQSLSFVKLDTLRISYRSYWTADTMNFLRSFSTVRHLHLVSIYAEDLLSAIQQEQSVSTSAWPELRIITLETPEADNVLNLCNFVTCHKQLQVVELSTEARRHLSSSLRRKGDSVYRRPSSVSADTEEGLDDVEEWLGKMVDIRTLLSPSVGLRAIEIEAI